MGNIQTLGDVIDFIEQNAPAGIAAAVPEPLAAAPAPLTAPAEAQAASIPADIDFKEMLLDVVAEKTGYPKEILTIDMGLESDLGIDSIKRVEIFSAVKDENPWLPEVDPSEMGNIQTLGDVIEFIEQNAPVANQPAGTPGETTADDGSEIQKKSAAKNTGIGRYVLKQIPAPHTGFTMTGLTAGGPVIITKDDAGVAEALADKLKKRGLDALVSEDIPEDTNVLIFLGGLCECHDEDSAIAINKDAFLAAKKVADRFSNHGGIFVIVQDTGGDFGLSGNTGVRAFLGGLPGLIKTAAHEWPNASVKSIDIEKGNRSADELAESLTDELFKGGAEKEVGLNADGSRHRLESVPALPNPANPADNRVDENSVIIASGGGRGVTATTLIELALQAKPRIVLLGRTPLLEEPGYCRDALDDAALKRALLENAKTEGHTIRPAELGAQARKIMAVREIQTTLRNLADAGSDARYLTCDVQDSDALNAALESVRRDWGPITGIVHGAGVLNDKLITEKTEDQFNLVFNTKVDGLRSLLSATKEDPINMICLFSSVAARFGNLGQCDYAMGNEILNKVANFEAYRRDGKCIVKSINWGPWDGGMVSPLLKDHFAKMGIPLIPLSEGACRLVEEIQEGSQQAVEVIIGPTPPPQGGFSGTAEHQTCNLSLIVNDSDYPFIDSHRIKDVPVVPVAMVLEWFSRAAQSCRPDLDFAMCKNLQVLKGIQLNDFATTGDLFKFFCKQTSNGNGSTIDFQIPGTNGAPYYRATVEMIEKDQNMTMPSTWNFDHKLTPWPWDLSEIYESQLFHGPDFQVIRSLEGVSDNAASAILLGTEEMNWPGGLWKTDVAAIDGGLQLAILWGIHLLGKHSLPTKIESYFNYRDGLAKGPVHCQLIGQAVDGNRTISDISFFDEQGNRFAGMYGVEMHMLADAGSKR